MTKLIGNKTNETYFVVRIGSVVVLKSSNWNHITEKKRDSHDMM